MADRPANAGTARRGGRASRAAVGSLAAVAVCALGAAWVGAGCSIEKNYKTLSFFFDGVPDPHARTVIPVAAGDVTSAGMTLEEMKKSPTYSVHKPYAEDGCIECHRGKLKITVQESGICLKCHKDEPTKHPRMHGPVAAGACLWCHHPHESAYAHLMRNTSRAVCTQCHVPQLLEDPRVPAHADAARDCLECHVGHGGERTYLLRDGIAAAGAASPAAPSPNSSGGGGRDGGGGGGGGGGEGSGRGP